MERSQQELAEPLLRRNGDTDRDIEEDSLPPPPTTTNEEIHSTNRNIRLTLLYTGLAFAGRSIWNQSVLATYVYLITSSNPEAVGFITAVMGCSQLLASFPTGYLADKHRRDSMLKVASAVGIVAILVTLAAMFLMQGSYAMLVVALGVWGCYWGIANTALGALFADSIPDGDRSYYFTKRSILINLGNTVGPSLALFMFFLLGDHWTVRDCAVVMALGNAICLPAVLALAFFNDDDSVHRAAQTNTDDPTEPMLPEDSEELDLNAGDTAPVQRQPTRNQSSHVLCELGRARQTDSAHSEHMYWCIPKHRLAPVLVSIADLTSGLASGMSIRYFPIFFLDTLHLSPVQVQLLYLLAPLLQACFMKSGQHFSQRFGRCKVTVAHKWSGITCMAALVALAHFEFPSWIICVVYVLRTALMNSTSPLTKSLLMDAVPPSERARWSALESVNMFSWSGSAALGGFLVSFDGLLFNFSVTATLQFLATIPIIALMTTIRTEEDNAGSDHSTAGVNPNTGGGTLEERDEESEAR